MADNSCSGLDYPWKMKTSLSICMVKRPYRAIGVLPSQSKTSTLLRSGCNADTSSPIGNCKAPIRLQAGTPLFSIESLSSVSICKRPRLSGLARRNALRSEWIPLKCATASKVQVRSLRQGIPMASSIDKTQTIAQPASGSSGNETARGRSIATRLTEA